jgi:hypothetical protein
VERNGEEGIEDGAGRDMNDEGKGGVKGSV